MSEQPTLHPERDPERGEPGYGPTGYLPDRAARRARKIVLRGEMSAGWPLAALAAALVLLVAGGLFLFTRGGPPPPPFEAVATFGEVGPRTVTRATAGEAGSVLLVHSGSALRALDGPPGVEVALCAASNRLEGSDGSVWQLDGRRVGGAAASLGSFPVRIEAGTVYVDPTEVHPPPPPAGGEVTPECDPE